MTFTRDDVEIEKREQLHDGFLKVARYQLRHRLFEGGWSKLITREVIERHQAVAALMYDPEHNTVGFVEQFRIGAMGENSPWVLEIVAGLVDKEAESLEEVLTRELEEEANVCARELRFITRYFPSPGGTDECLHLYCALCDLSEAGGIYGLEEEGEDIRVVVLPVEEALAALYSPRINNAATLIALQWLQWQQAQGKI